MLPAEGAHDLDRSFQYQEDHLLKFEINQDGKRRDAQS